MINEFEPVVNGIQSLMEEWEPKLKALPGDVIVERRNSQHRNIKQILGHMIDSASNNTHRIIHLQYRENPLHFPNYATHGNNDRWIAIQNYEEENWEDMINLWKYLHLHIIHTIKNIASSKLNNEWYCSENETVSLMEMVIDFLRHFELHLNEIDELINKT